MNAPSASPSPDRPSSDEPQRTARPDAAHDPGPEAARTRAVATGAPHGEPIRIGGARILVGTAGWTDRTLTAAGVFYPDAAKTPEDRLRFYASRFPLVEVDATYYALPSRRMAELWAERTPDDFTFDVKANALMTGHPSEVSRLPKELRDALPEALAAKARIYATDLPAELEDAVWATFLDALEPLRSSGKLGGVLLQYPRWFGPTRDNARALVEASRRLGDVTGTVELRNRDWFSDRLRERTLGLLAEHDIPFVMVDAPQGHRSSVPPMAATTSARLAVVRLHGRRVDTWERPGVGVAERFRYLYDRGELAEWLPRIGAVAAAAREVHVVFNNCYANYGTTNAAEMMGMLAEEAR
ncbi:MAG TPA: DUF72 domain-containing protein [Gemmatimonadaceae bacterium]